MDFRTDSEVTSRFRVNVILVGDTRPTEQRAMGASSTMDMLKSFDMRQCAVAMRRVWKSLGLRPARGPGPLPQLTTEMMSSR